MQRSITVNLGNLVLSLSDAMDLASPALIHHQQRVAFVTWEMAKAAKISNERLERSFIAALLHDIGALTLEDKIALRLSETDNTEEHCVRGGLLIDRVPWFKNSARIIGTHHTHWQEWNDSIENPIVFDSQIVSLSDFLERLVDRDQYILFQNERIVEEIRSNTRSLFHPMIVDLFLSVCNREEFWLDLVSPRLYSILLNEGPFRKIEIILDDIALISELFRDIIDFRSHFTATHSSGVAASASILAKIFGLTDMEIRLMEVAGNLHDLGKLAVPNSILEKPGKLTKEEMAVIKSHTYYTYFIINTIGGLQSIAEWAAYHHERLDGTGYPFHCAAGELSTGSRIMMVADIFTALAEDRPYRNGMSRKEVMEIIGQLSRRQSLDTRIVDLLFDNYEEVYSCMAEKQNCAREFYEKQSALCERLCR